MPEARRLGVLTQSGGRLVVVDGVTPAVDGGRFPAKRVLGDLVAVEADVYADGHDSLSCRLRYRHESDTAWVEAPMRSLANDRWRGTFEVTRLGLYRFAVDAWIDQFESWRRDLAKRHEAGQDLSVDLLIGADLVDGARTRASGRDDEALEAAAAALRGGGGLALTRRVEHALSDDLADLMGRYPARQNSTTYDPGLAIAVEREKARYSAWYELFPRSSSPEPGRHGTFKDVEGWLPYVASMGFDVLYLPPIHPIGRAFRKGKNNAVTVQEGDPGSPWAIGSAEGGHKSVHPQLGSVDDFRRLIAKARQFGIEIAIDVAFQCSADHPYLREHPEWFRKRPDGTIQYAENPPKKYQDIYPLDFDTACREALWEELKSVFLYWVEQGVQIFRVDNPHTKPFSFWEWVIGQVKAVCPEAIFLSEAFTRPKVMYQLAKLGFTQSYTYFAWRNTKEEIIQYFTELTQAPVKDFFRPNLWPNTPDILTEYLQFGGRPAFMARLVLAATLGASYGIYGPAFELQEAQPREPGSEEYLDSEKYEIKHWDIHRADSLRPFITRVNDFRRRHPALHSDASLRFHDVDNDQLVGYSKTDEKRTDVVVTVVNLDLHHTQAGWLSLPIQELGLDPSEPYQAHDALTDARYLWHGPRNYVELNPQSCPAHIFSLRKRLRTERDFEYFL